MVFCLLALCFAFFWTSYKWNHIGLFWIWFLLLNIIYVKYIQGVTCGRSSFFFFFTAVMPLCHYTQFIFPLYYWWTLAISVFELLWIMLLWTFLYFSDSGHAYSLKLTLYLGVEHWIRGSLYADYLLHQTVLFITGYRTD